MPMGVPGVQSEEARCEAQSQRLLRSAMHGEISSSQAHESTIATCDTEYSHKYTAMVSSDALLIFRPRLTALAQLDGCACRCAAVHHDCTAVRSNPVGVSHAAHPFKPSRTSVWITPV